MKNYTLHFNEYNSQYSVIDENGNTVLSDLRVHDEYKDCCIDLLYNLEQHNIDVADAVFYDNSINEYITIDELIAETK